MKRISMPTQLLLFVCGLLLCAAVLAKKPPQEWDGLSLVKLKGMDVAYVRPGATFTQYDKIIIDPIEVSFSKGWDKEETFSGNKLSGKQLDEIKTKIAALAEETFGEVLSKDGGPQVVTEAGPDVLRFSSAIIDVFPNAVDTQEPGRSYAFTTSAGSATLYAELRDSETNQLIGRVVDGREARNTGQLRWTNSVENTHQARMMVQDWARILRKRYDALREAAGKGDAVAKQ